MDSRQKFEEWMVETADRFHPDFTRRGIEGEYQNVGTEHDWCVWQASRQSLVVALPDPFWPGYVEDDEPGLCISTNLFTIEQITEALADQGIRTK